MHAIRVIVQGTLVVAVGLLPPVGAAQELPQAGALQERAGVVTTLHGSATVARVSLPVPSPLKFKDDVFVHDRITTADNSIARILLGGKAVVTVRERSVLTITETPTTSTIDLTGGKIALAVAKEQMKPGETVEIRTPNAVAGIRGTIVIAEVTPIASSAVSTTFTLLTGVIDVTRLDAGMRRGSPVILNPLQSLTIAPGATPQPIQQLTKPEAQRVSVEYRIEVKEAPKSGVDSLSQREVERAVASLGDGQKSATGVLAGASGDAAKDASAKGNGSGDGSKSGGEGAKSGSGEGAKNASSEGPKSGSTDGPKSGNGDSGRGAVSGGGSNGAGAVNGGGASGVGTTRASGGGMAAGGPSGASNGDVSVGRGAGVVSANANGTIPPGRGPSADDVREVNKKIKGKRSGRD